MHIKCIINLWVREKGMKIYTAERRPDQLIWPHWVFARIIDWWNNLKKDWIDCWIELLKPWNYWPNIETTENMTTFNKSQLLFYNSDWKVDGYSATIWNYVEIENKWKKLFFSYIFTYFIIYQTLLRFMKDFWHEYIFHLTVLKLIVAIGDKLTSFSSFPNQFCVWEPSSTRQFS